MATYPTHGTADWDDDLFTWLNVSLDTDGSLKHEVDASAAHAASAISFSPTGTVAATNVQSAIAEVASEAGGGGSSPSFNVFDVTDYGAIGNGSADDTSALANAIAAADSAGGGVVYLPEGTYKTTSALTIDTTNTIRIVGDGRRVSYITNAASNMFTLGGAHSLQFFSVEHVQLYATGGHIFFQGATVTAPTFYEAELLVDSATKSIWDNDSKVLTEAVFLNCFLGCNTAASVPAFNLSATGGKINANRWEKCRATCGSTATASFWKITCTDADKHEGNVFRDINLETPNGGGIELLGVHGTVLDKVEAFDVTTSTRNIIIIGESTSGSIPSEGVTILNYKRYLGTIGGGLNDIKLNTGAQKVLLINPSAKTGTDVTIDLNSSYSILIYAAHTSDLTLSNSAFSVVLGPNGIVSAGADGGLRTSESGSQKQGTATLIGGAKVVSDSAVTANSRIFLTSQVDGGTPGFLRVSTRTASTSFTVTSSSGTDTSTFAYEIFEPA